MRIGFFISPYDKINYTWVKYLKIKEIIKNVRKQVDFISSNFGVGEASV